MTEDVIVKDEALKMMVIEIGVRRTARLLGMNVNTLKSRSARGRWLMDLPKDVAALNRKACKQHKMTPSEALVHELKDINQKSTMSLARGLQKGAEAIEQMDGKEIVEKGTEVKSVVQSISAVHGWKAGSKPATIALNITGAKDLTIEGSDDAIEAEWSESDSMDEED